MMFKENWTNLPKTVAQAKRFFIGNKDQQTALHRETDANAIWPSDLFRAPDTESYP